MPYSKLKWLLLSFLTIDLIFINFVAYKFITSSVPDSPPIQDPMVDCPKSCINKINQAITSIPASNSVSVTPIPSRTQNQTTIIQNKEIRSTTYLPISGNSQSTSNIWENLYGTEFNFDTGDYPNLKEAYFEANIKLFNGNGLAYVRLFDTTAGIEVWGSEVTSQNQNYMVVVSGKLTLRSGNHLYRVQAKSLTADTAVFNYGRLKLISKD
jgi:hypothetical protein